MACVPCTYDEMKKAIVSAISTKLKVDPKRAGYIYSSWVGLETGTIGGDGVISPLTGQMEPYSNIGEGLRKMGYNMGAEEFEKIVVGAAMPVIRFANLRYSEIDDEMWLIMRKSRLLSSTPSI